MNRWATALDRWDRGSDDCYAPGMPGALIARRSGSVAAIHGELSMDTVAAMSELNRWWEGLPSERYWMEITDREDLGSDLWAPKFDDGGRAYWGYNLVTEVRYGDVVLHWHKTLQGAPAMVGWSLVSGPPEHSEIAGERHLRARRRSFRA
jgi:hypothetical protein